MNLKELKEHVDWNYNNYHTRDIEDTTVQVVLSEPGMGGTPSINVKALHMGFDWDSGKLMIYTEEPVVRKTNKKQLNITNSESEFNKDMIKTLTKYREDRESKLILEVFNCLKRHYTPKKK